MTMNYQFKWLTLLVLAVGIGGYFETGAVTLDANGYNVVVAVSSSVSTIAVDERVNFLKTIKVIRNLFIGMNDTETVFHMRRTSSLKPRSYFLKRRITICISKRLIFYYQRRGLMCRAPVQQRGKQKFILCKLCIHK